MMLRAGLRAARRRVLSFLNARSVALDNNSPLASFCFDDFPRTAFTTGGRVLKTLGARGTYYAAMGLMRTTTQLGEHFRRSDLDSLLADGHELGCHTYHHVSCRALSLTAFTRDVRQGCQAIREITRGGGALSFAYPYGHVTLRAKSTIGGEMASCRGIYAGANAGTADLNLLHANSLYGDVERFDVIERIIHSSAAPRTWLIFYTHDVCPRPSPFGCTPALLERVVCSVMETGYRVETVANVVGLLSTRDSPAAC